MQTTPLIPVSSSPGPILVIVYPLECLPVSPLLTGSEAAPPLSPAFPSLKPLMLAQLYVLILSCIQTLHIFFSMPGWPALHSSGTELTGVMGE